eukprot:3931733-Rhodomonas_salina.1
MDNAVRDKQEEEKEEEEDEEGEGEHTSPAIAVLPKSICSMAPFPVLRHCTGLWDGANGKTTNEEIRTLENLNPKV